MAYRFPTSMWNQLIGRLATVTRSHGRDWVIDQVHRVCDLAEVPRVTAHAMRGLLATITAERGMAGHLIATTLGHEDERTTMHAYAAPGSAAAGDRHRGLVVLNGGAQAAGKSAEGGRPRTRAHRPGGDRGGGAGVPGPVAGSPSYSGDELRRRARGQASGSSVRR